MKKIFSLGLMLVALTLMNCSKEEIVTEAPAVNGAAFELFASTEDGRTVNDGWSTLWDEGDQINVFHAVAGTTEYKNDTPKVDVVEYPFVVKDTESGLFVGDLMGGALAEGTNYDWYLFYPYSSHIVTPANNSAGYTYIGSRSDRSQAQTGVDNMTHIAGSNYPLYGKALDVPANKAPVVTMKNIASLIEFAVKNTESEAIAISEIQFTSTEDIVGSYFIDFSGETLGFTPSRADYVSATGKLSITEATIAAGATAKFYMAVKPHAVSAGDLTIKVTADAGACTKTLEGVTTTFTAGKVKTINFTYVAPAPTPAETWSRVTSVEELVSGGEYIILGYDKDKTKLGYLPSTTTGSAPTFTVATDFAEMPVTIELTPAENMRWTFTADGTNWKIQNADAKYLYATDANNGIRVGGTVCSWTITGHEKNSSAFLFKPSTLGRYMGVYLQQDWRAYTSWFASNFGGENGVGSQIYLYYKGTLAAKTPLATPTVTASVQNVNEIVASWTAVDGAADYTVTCGDKSATIAELTYTFTGMSYETEYTVEVVANPSDVAKNVASEAGKSNVVTTGASVYSTIAEVLESASTTATYAVKDATVVAVANYSALVTDGTGYLFLYNKPSGCAVGDIYELEFTLSQFGNVWQGNTLKSYTKTGTTTVTYPEPVVYGATELNAVTSSNVAALAKAGTYVKIAATLNINGNYYNLKNTGADKDSSLVNPGSGSAIAKLNGKPIVVTGYLVYQNSGYNYIIATEAEETDHISVEPAALEWAADSTEEKTVTVSSNKEGWTYTAPDWVTVTPNGTTLTIAPKAANESTEEDVTGEIVLTHATDSSIKATIELKQQKVATGTLVTLLSEDFSAITSGNSTSTGGSSSAWSGNSNFSVAGKVYQAGGAVKLGSGSATGTITTTAKFNMSTELTVTVKVKGWTSVEGKIKISAGDQEKEVVYKEVMTSEFGTYSVTFAAAAGVESTIAITHSAKRVFIDEVEITTMQ